MKACSDKAIRIGFFLSIALGGCESSQAADGETPTMEAELAATFGRACAGSYTNPTLTQLGNCTSLSGDLTFDGTRTIPTLSKLTKITGSLSMTGLTGTSYSGDPFPALTEVTGNLYIKYSAAQLVGYSILGKLSSVGGDLTLTQQDSLSTYSSCASFGALASVGGTLFARMISFSGDVFPSLVTVGEDLRFANASWSGSTLPLLASVGDDLILSELTASSFEAPSLATVNGDINVLLNSNLATLSLAHVTEAGGIDISRNDVLSLVSASSLYSLSEDLVVHDNPQLASSGLVDLASRIGKPTSYIYNNQ